MLGRAVSMSCAAVRGETRDTREEFDARDTLNLVDKCWDPKRIGFKLLPRWQKDHLLWTVHSQIRVTLLMQAVQQQSSEYFAALADVRADDAMLGCNWLACKSCKQRQRDAQSDCFALQARYERTSFTSTRNSSGNTPPTKTNPPRFRDSGSGTRSADSLTHVLCVCVCVFSLRSWNGFACNVGPGGALAH